MGLMEQLTGRSERRPEKDRAVDGAIAGIQKAFGKGAIMRLGDAEPVPVSAVSTGSVVGSPGTELEFAL